MSTRTHTPGFLLAAFLVALLLLTASGALFAQSLLDDPGYKALIDEVDALKTQAQAAIDPLAAG